MKFRCPKCNKRYDVKDELAGKRAKRSCGNSLVIPNPRKTIDLPSCPECTLPLRKGETFCRTCGFDLKTGEKKWQERAVGKGSISFADGMLYLFGEKDGEIALATCSPDGMEIKGRFKVQSDGPSWAHPVIIGGRMYLRYDDNLYCYDVSEK